MILKIRKLVEERSSLESLLNRVDTIEKGLELSDNSAIDASKSTLEAICKTTLIDRGIECLNPSFTNLVKTTFNVVSSSQDISSKDQASFIRIIGGINSLSQGIAELRNNNSYFSHGQDLHQQSLNRTLLVLVVDICDALCCYFINSQTIYDLTITRVRYENNKEFNEWYDFKNPLVVEGINLSSSRTIFDQDLEAYKEFILDFKNRLLNRDDDLMDELKELGIEKDG